jgi:prepilin peptidase CpaA
MTLALTLIGWMALLTILWAMVEDLLTFRIPNTIPAFLVLLVAVGSVGIGVAQFDWLGHLGAGLLTLAGGALLFHFRMLGGGDAKLLAAVALWFGWSSLAEYLVLVGLLGGAFGLMLLVVRRTALASVPAWARLGLALPRVLREGEPVPYGVAIGGAALAVMAMNRNLGLS